MKTTYSAKNLPPQTQVQKIKELIEQWPVFNDSYPKGKKSLYQFLKRQKEIVVYGGSFNPPHLGHLHCYKSSPSKCTILVPDKNPRKEIKEVKNPLDRLIDLQDFFYVDLHLIMPHFLISEDPNPTVNLIKEFSSKIKNTPISLLVGGDSFLTIDSWIDADFFLKKIHKLYVIPRNNDLQVLGSLKEKMKEKHQLEVDISPPHLFENLSSTKMRQEDY